MLATASCSIRGQNFANLQPFGNSISFDVVLAIHTGTVLSAGVTTKWATCNPCKRLILSA